MLFRSKCAEYLNSESLTVLNMDMRQLDETWSNKFDAVTAMNSIYNVDEQLNVMTEVYRVIKPGGRFLISGPLPTVDIEYIARQMEDEFRQKGLYEALKEDIKKIIDINKELMEGAIKYTSIEMILLLNDIGFTSVIYSTEKPYLGNAYFVAVRK